MPSAADATPAITRLPGELIERTSPMIARIWRGAHDDVVDHYEVG